MPCPVQSLKGKEVSGAVLQELSGWLGSQDRQRQTDPAAEQQRQE